MALDVHAHERRELHEARIDAAKSTGIAQRHGRDQILLEPLDRPGIGERVHLGRVDARVDWSRHQGHAAGLRGIAGLRHHRGGDEHGDARLAHRHDVRAWPDRLQETDQVRDIVVEAEPAVRERDIAHVVPVGDVDVVLGQHGAHGTAQERREMTRQRRDQEHARLRRVDILLEVQKRAERRGQRGVLVDRDLAVADCHAIDPEGGTGVGQPGARDELVGRGEVAQRGVVGDADQRLAERPQGGARPAANRNHNVGMGLISLVEHSPPGGARALLPGRPRAPAHTKS